MSSSPTPPSPDISPPANEIPAKRTVTSVTRGWSDMDLGRWFSLLGMSGMVYSTLFHPSYVAVARKQTCRGENIAVSTFCREIYKDTGFKGFFRGFAAMTFGGILAEFAYMGLIESGREMLPMQSQFYRDVTAGAVADVVSSVIYIPFGLISNRQMTAGYGVCDYKYGNSWECSKVIYQKRGFQGFFVGLLPQLLLMPASGLWWGVYGKSKAFLYDQHALLMAAYGSYALSLPSWMTSSTDNYFLNSVAGAVSGVTLTFMANPLWVVKARMQVMDVPASGALRYVVRDLVAKEGYRAFYKGATVNCVVYGLECGIFGILYELWKELACI